MTAADGDSLHSPFTMALLKHLVTPGLDVRLALGRVRDQVLAYTANKQEPFVYGSLGGNTVTLASLSKDNRTDVPAAGDPDAPAARDYEAAAKVGTKEAWDSFLAKYPVGFYSDLAKVQRDRLKDLATSEKASKSSAIPSVDPQPKSEKKKKEKSQQAGSSNMACCVAYYHRYGWPDYQIYGAEGSCRSLNLATLDYCKR